MAAPQYHDENNPDFQALPPAVQQEIRQAFALKKIEFAQEQRAQAENLRAPPTRLLYDPTKDLETPAIRTQRLAHAQASGDTELARILSHQTPGQPSGRGVLPLLGGVGGSLAATALIPATAGAAMAAIPAAGTLGSTLGLTLESLLFDQRLPTGREAATEFALSAVPEVAQTAWKVARTPLRRGFQRSVAEGKIPLLKGTRGGQTLRNAEQYRLAQSQLSRIFNTPTEEAVDTLFTEVRRSGVTLDTTPLVKRMQTYYDPIEKRLLQKEIRQADAVINQRLHTTGARDFMELWAEIEAASAPVRPGGFAPPAPSVDISDIQDLRSAMRERIAHAGGDDAKRGVLQTFKDDVDRMVTDLLTPGGGLRAETAEKLLAAREGWFRLKSAEELGDFFNTHSADATGKGNITVLRLNSVRDALRKNTTGSAQRTNQALDNIPGARERFDELIQELEPLSKQFEAGISGGDVSGITRDSRVAAMFRGISEVIVSPRGVALFLDVAKKTQGPITPNILANVLSAIRRKEMPDLEGITLSAEDQLRLQNSR